MISSDKPVLKKRKLEDEDDEKETTSVLPDTPSDLIITTYDISKSHKINTLPMKANRYIKHILSLWETSMQTPELLLETKKSLFPMLVKLRKSTLTNEALTSLLTILYHMQRGEFMRANESYMKLSIGNVAWPIGVASVSIHSRKSQAKTEEGQKAMIMLDETTRKWITAVKRLITFKEKYTAKIEKEG